MLTLQITEIKDAINSPGSTNSSSRSQQSPEAMEGPWLLFGQKQKVTATEIICSLPSREVVDSLIEIFLRSLGVPPCMSIATATAGVNADANV